jgi:hypothetical protein
MKKQASSIEGFDIKPYWAAYNTLSVLYVVVAQNACVVFCDKQSAETHKKELEKRGLVCEVKTVEKG